MASISYRDMNPGWSLSRRLLVSGCLYAVLLLGSVGAALGPDLFGHLLAGAMGWISLRGLWSTLQDAVIWWPCRHKRNFVEPDQMTGKAA